MASPKKTKPTKEILKRSQALKAKKRVGKFVIFAILIILLFSGLGYLLYLPALSVQTTSVQGNDILEAKDILAEVGQALIGKYWYLFPKRSIFIYPQQTIVAVLLKQFPRLSAVEVGSAEWNSLVVNVKERDSDVIWCQDSGSLSVAPKPVIETGATSSPMASSTESVMSVPNTPDTSDQDCYFSDDTGFIFAPAPYFSNSVFIELVGLLADQPISQMPLSSQSYTIVTHLAKNLTKIFGQTANDKYRLIKVNIIDQNNYEALIVDTSNTINSDWKIFFNNSYSAEELTSNLYTILNSEPFKKEMLANKGNLASIDLRYGKKVFYKFK